MHRLGFVVCLAALAASASSARADEIQLTVANGVVALSDGTSVRVFDESGRALTRLPNVERTATPSRAHDERRDIFDAHNIQPEAQQSSAAEALVENEASLRAQRAARADAAARSAATDDAARIQVAAAHSDLWIAVGSTLHRVDARGTTVVTRLPAAPEALAAGPDMRLAFAQGSRILTARAPAPTFEVTGALDVDAPATAVALIPSTLVWASATGLHSLGTGDEAPARITNTPPLDLRRCGDAVVALDRGGLWVTTGTGWQRRAAPTSARHLRCSEDGGLWLLWGAGASLSRDHGASFVSLPATWVTADDVAPTAQGILRALGGELDLAPWSSLTDSSAPVDAPAIEPRLSFVRRPLVSLLPKVILQAQVSQTQERKAVQGFLLAEFPLTPPIEGPRPPPAARPAPPPPRAWPLIPAHEKACLEAARSQAVALALAEPDRARSYVSRARTAGWLPELRFRVEKTRGRDESLDLDRKVTTGTAPVGIDTQDDVRYEARATWDLARLVFSQEELSAETQALRMADARNELSSLINRLFFERRRLTMESTLPSDDDPNSTLRRHVRVEELNAELDALTAGAFSRCEASR